VQEEIRGIPRSIALGGGFDSHGGVRSLVFSALVLAALSLAPGRTPDLERAAAVRGVTISCQTSGPEWGRDGFGEELDRLVALGVNWVSIHPYARIAADGTVACRYDLETLPDWILRPIAEAHARGMQIMIKPHLAYWGSPFEWRGAIDFEETEARERFFRTYTEWIVGLARGVGDADAFAVGTELDRLVEHEADWRGLVARVRAVSDVKLTYAANWSDYERVPFWDALDAIGVQAYFPLVDEGAAEPDDAALEAGWERALTGLKELHERTGKPVVFTELGYDSVADVAVQPWVGRGRRDRDGPLETPLQMRCYTVALRVLEREREWLRGAFLWKWFVGPAPRANFLLDVPGVRQVLRSAWADGSDTSETAR
jgi:hypothetical protein